MPEEAEMDDRTVSERVRDAVAEAVRDTGYSPDNGILVDVVVIMGWLSPDDSNDVSIAGCGTPWGMRGLINEAHDRTEAHGIVIDMVSQDVAITVAEDGDDDDDDLV